MQKAEILRLRLGLASYKLRTGQTDVPLERLQIKPIPGRAPDVPSSSSQSGVRFASTTTTIRANSSQGTSSRPGARRPLPSSRRSSQEEVWRTAQPSSAPRQRHQPRCSSESDEDEDIVLSQRGEPAQRREPRPTETMLPSLRGPVLGGGSIDTLRQSRLVEEEEQATSCALRGGAVNGLLRLSMSRG